uniref:SDR family NAD(P)-dependent oxidoreductase n=1 Tax=Escherichia marmotae TaxID=1499973 RepID=UPI00215B387B
ATVKQFGKLNVLVNNAGMVVPATPETTTLEQFRLHSAIMSEGTFLGCKHAIPVMQQAGGGSIINMCSVATHLGYPVF